MTFNAQGMLNQLLSSGQSAVRGGSPRSAAPGRGASTAAGGLMSQLGGGAAVGSALSMLMGSRRRRSGSGGGLMSHGGAAALGALAYRAYTEWQSRQPGGAGAGEPRTLDRVSADEAEAQSQAILKAVVAAAKADGHIDDAERSAIEAEFDKAGSDPELRRWLVQELSSPLDPEEVARAADSPAVASEMYLASRLIVDEENFMERAYLDELARCLKLDRQLQERLDQEAASARAH